MFIEIIVLIKEGGDKTLCPPLEEEKEDVH